MQQDQFGAQDIEKATFEQSFNPAKGCLNIPQKVNGNHKVSDKYYIINRLMYSS